MNREYLENLLQVFLHDHTDKALQIKDHEAPGVRWRLRLKSDAGLE